MDFEDPLADILSDGSNDSFFDDARPSSTKRGSITKTPEKKSISDLFGLSDEKKPDESTPKTGTDWLGLGDAKPKQQQQQSSLSMKTKKISFEDTDDLLDTLGLDKKRDDSTKAEKPKETALPQAKLEPAKKSALLESILGTPKKSDDDTKPFAKPATAAPVAAKKPDPAFGFQSLDAPRDGRRRPASGIKDPLGLFAADDKRDDRQTVRASPIRKRETSKTPDRLGESGDGDATSTEVLFPARGDMKTKSAPNLTNLPDWLSASSANEPPLKSHKSDTGIDSIDRTETNARPHEDVDHRHHHHRDDGGALQAMLAEQKLTTSHVEYRNTAIALQQQESQILMTLQLKKYEENLMAMQRQQQELLTKQEQQFNGLLERQFAKQQILENNMQLQQERINRHIQMLLSQPSVAPSATEARDATETEELKKANADERVKLYESLIESLKERHREELFLVEESYKKQVATLEQSSESVANRLRNELDETKRSYDEKYEQLKRDRDAESERSDRKTLDLIDRHNAEIQALRVNHDRVVDAIKYEYDAIIENMKETKQKETELFANSATYGEKLTGNIQMLRTNSQMLIELNEKVETGYGALTMAREEGLRAREEEIKLMRNALEKARESAESERTQLMGLVRGLELKLVEQTQNVKEERWAMQQAAATLVARTSALEREAEFNRKSIEYEREQLKTLKATLLAEQERLALQLTEEKLTLAGERSKLETSMKLSESYDTQRTRAEIDAAVQVAKEATATTDRERERLQRERAAVEAIKRNLIDRERQLEHREIALNESVRDAERKANEGARALKEAKSLEASYNERLRGIQNQLVHLTNREKRLAEEKIALSKERLAFNDYVRKRKQCSLCAVDDPIKTQIVHDEADDVALDRVVLDPVNNAFNSELTNLRRELQQTRRRFQDTMSE